MAAVAVDRAMDMFRARQRNTGQAGQVNPDVVQIEIHLECSNLANLDVMSKSDPVRVAAWALTASEPWGVGPLASGRQFGLASGGVAMVVLLPAGLFFTFF